MTGSSSFVSAKRHTSHEVMNDEVEAMLVFPDEAAPPSGAATLR
jgi:hypothetical protein